MELSEKKVQELKDKKVSIEELNDEYFFAEKDEVNVENVLTLLTENICSFKEIVDKFRGIDVRDTEDTSDAIWLRRSDTIWLERLIENRGLYEKLIGDNILTKDDLQHLLNTIDNWYELNGLSWNTTLLTYIIDNELFQDLVDTFKSTKDDDDHPYLHRLINNNKLFEKLRKNEKLTKDDLMYLLNKIDESSELWRLCDNTFLLNQIAENKLFQELVDKFKGAEDDDQCLKYLLWNREFFKELISNNRLNKEDTRYLLNTIDNDNELHSLCKNASLIKYILNKFILDKETVDKFNEIIEEIYWCKDENIHTIFELTEHENKSNEEILKLTELNRLMYLLTNFDLTEDQKLELAEVLKDNEIVQNRLSQIIDNNLESQYDFDALKNLLTKDEKKKKIKLNF